MFYLTTHSTHFSYGYMASHIWLRTIMIVRKETRCRHIGYSLRLTARVLLYAPSHRQDSTYHGLCYTSRGSLAGTRNIVLGMLKHLDMMYLNILKKNKLKGTKRELYKRNCAVFIVLDQLIYLFLKLFLSLCLFFIFLNRPGIKTTSGINSMFIFRISVHLDIVYFNV